MLPTKQSSNLIAFLAAILLYGSLVWVLADYLVSQQEWIERFSSQKDDFMDIVLVDREDSPAPKKSITKPSPPAPKPKPKPQVPEKKSEPAKKESSTKPLANVKDLFRGVDTSTLEEPSEIPQPNPKNQSRLKPEKTEKKAENKPSVSASKLVGSLEFEEAGEAKSLGTYDPFKGKISELLDGYWQQTIDTISGVEATVKIGVDGDGIFSYSIVSLSYNNAFNAKLRDFLERMKNVSFPPYSGDGTMYMNIKFKDMME